jgi:lysozyme family protein
MANFTEAYKITTTHEGGYGIDNNGYEVYRGINRYYNPNWNGWAYIDRAKQVTPNIPRGTIIPSAEPYVMQYVKNTYWDKIKGDQITNQKFANFLFDFYYASGYDAIKMLQKILGLNPDGIIGPITLAAINKQLSYNGQNLYDKLWQTRYDFTKSLVGKIIPESWWKGIEQRLFSYKVNIGIATGATLLVALFFLGLYFYNKSN